MKIISHRGNLRGRIPNRENTPSYIDSAIGCGFDVEIDVRFIEGQFMLGHDSAQIIVNNEWLNRRKNKLWIHCKDIMSAVKIRELDESFRIFCHSNDPFVLVSTGHIWVHDLSLEFDKHAIIPLLDQKELDLYDHREVYAFCTDYVFSLDSMLRGKRKQ